MGLSFLKKALLAFPLLLTAVLIGSFFAFRAPFPLAAVKPAPEYTRPAMHWERMDLGVKCGLCPFNCYLPEGAKGKCRVRMNRGSVLYTMVYGQPVSLALDPIEKKPVFHMLPGTPILSLATVGCPLRCSFCQNWTISQVHPEQIRETRMLSPAQIVEAAVERGIPSLAYTYGEPVIFYEYMLDTARMAKKSGLRNVVVTSGFINPEPLRELAPYLDVVKVDLKGISDDFYAREVSGYLDPVLAAIKLLRELGVLVEIVNLVVPGRNDAEEDIRRLARWVKENAGADSPLFFSRFHPDFRLRDLPPTPLATLEKAREIALSEGLRYVYIGNVPGHEAENTYCPVDGTVLIRRRGYLVEAVNLRNGRCPVCGRKVPGIWK